MMNDPTQRKHSHREAGLSIVAVLILLGLITLAALIVGRSVTSSIQTNVALTARQNYASIDEAVKSTLGDLLHTNIGNGAGCVNLAAAINSPQFMQFSQNINLGAYGAASETDVPGITRARAAAGRCNGPVLPADPGDANNNKMYFCVDFLPNPATPAGSIVNSPVSFAEVHLELIDLQTYAPMSCEEYSQRRIQPEDGSAGLVMVVWFHWLQARGNNTGQFYQKAMTSIVNQTGGN